MSKRREVDTATDRGVVLPKISFSHQEGDKIAQGENVGILSKHWASTTGIDPFC